MPKSQRGVRVGEVRVRVALEAWEECFKLRHENKLPNIEHHGNQLYSMPVRSNAD